MSVAPSTVNGRLPLETYLLRSNIVEGMNTLSPGGTYRMQADIACRISLLLHRHYFCVWNMLVLVTSLKFKEITAVTGLVQQPVRGGRQWQHRLPSCIAHSAIWNNRMFIIIEAGRNADHIFIRVNFYRLSSLSLQPHLRDKQNHYPRSPSGFR